MQWFVNFGKKKPHKMGFLKLSPPANYFILIYTLAIDKIPKHKKLFLMVKTSENRNLPRKIPGVKL